MISAGADEERLGTLVLEARRGAGLTAKELADHLGISLWTVEQIERGAVDPTEHLEKIGQATATPPSWWAAEATPRPPGRGTVAAEEEAGDSGGYGVIGRHAVLAALGLLVAIRFFTEVVGVLPRALNFVDIPILTAMVALAAVTPRPARAGPRSRLVLGAAVVFLAISGISALSNLSRIEAAPVLVFVYGFLAPVLLYQAVYRVWPAGSAGSMSRLLIHLGILQLVVVVVIDLPRFFANELDPDLISGTFGTNPYQLVFFLLVLTGLVSGIFTFEPRRAAARLAPVLVLSFLAVILLAQFRALLFTTALTLVLIVLLLGSARARGAMLGVVTLAGSLFIFFQVASSLPNLKLLAPFEETRSDPSGYIGKRIDALGIVGDLYSDNPRFIITGSGPGTFSSRAWATFAFKDSTSKSNVQGPLATRVIGKAEYRTDVSEKYTIPAIQAAEVISGSHAVTNPRASLSSLMAEVGIPGLLAMAAVYLFGMVASMRMALATRKAALPGDPLPALAIATAVAFFVLAQLALLENWLEVTRVTFFVWLLFAVVAKEYNARTSEPRGRDSWHTGR